MLSFTIFVSVFPFHRLQVKKKVEKLNRLGTCGSPQPFDPFYSSSHPNSWFNTGSLPGVSGYSTSWVFCPHLCSFQANRSRERSVPFTHPWQQKDKSVQNTAVSSFSFLQPQIGAQWSSLRSDIIICAFKNNFSHGSNWFLWLLICREWRMAPVKRSVEPSWTRWLWAHFSWQRIWPWQRQKRAMPHWHRCDSSSGCHKGSGNGLDLISKPPPLENAPQGV